MILTSTLFISNSGLSAATCKVYAFWPYDTNPSTYQPNWDSLTHVAYFCFGVNGDGTLVEPDTIDQYYTVRDLAHKHGKKVIISIKTSDVTAQDTLIALHSQDFANNVLNALSKYQADGVNLDFEATASSMNTITHTSSKPMFENFMKNLYITLKNSNPNYHVSFCNGPSMNVLGNKNLSNYTDAVFIMVYDYTNWQGITGPNSPLKDPKFYGVNNDVDEFLKYYPAQKLILGIPFYGYIYTATSNQKGAISTSYDSIPMSTAIRKASTYGRLWDLNSSTPWFVYKTKYAYYQVWYDDPQSIELKYNYAKSKSLGGLGIFCLGREGINAYVWNVFKSKP
jgi:spore germination protein YaaH